MKARISIDILKENKDLTVGELLTKIEEQNKALEEKEKNQINLVKEQFNGKFFKGIDNCVFFGKTLEVIHVQDIDSHEKNTNFDPVYHIKGTRISFSKRDVNLTQLNNRIQIEKLNGYKEITEEEFNEYQNKLDSIQTTLLNIIEEK